MSVRVRLGLGIAVVLASGDAAAAVDELTTERPVLPIIGGEETEPGEFDGVVAVIAGTGLCTGTVVADRLVLTAAHCLAGLRADAEIEVWFGDELDSTNRVPVESYGVHPQFCGECTEDIFDYGYVVIAADFTVPGGFILPITTQDEWDQAMVPGREVTLVGYGEDPAVDAIDAGIGVKRKVTTTIRRQTDGGLEFYAGGMMQDSCRGDSGGPAFVRVGDGTLRLGGITSRGSDPCGDGGYYGAPYPALCWVRDETGVDLVGDACNTCDCLDMAPEKDEGCTVARAPVERGRTPWISLVAIAVLHRMRRRPS